MVPSLKIVFGLYFLNADANNKSEKINLQQI